nr:MAG TPA: hypothetical protein [Caudoviricetes sp.]
MPFLFYNLYRLGGVDQKTAARPGRFRGGGPSRISHISPHIPHISAYPPSSHLLPFFLAFFWFYPQNFISLGQNYNYV